MKRIKIGRLILYFKYCSLFFIIGHKPPVFFCISISATRSPLRTNNAGVPPTTCGSILSPVCLCNCNFVVFPLPSFINKTINVSTALAIMWCSEYECNYMFPSDSAWYNSCKLDCSRQDMADCCRPLCG